MGYAFISYSTKNQTAADAIKNIFNKLNIDTWMAPYNIPAGSKYAAAITGAIRDCSCFVLLLSKDSQASEAVDCEVELATLTYKKSIITVQLEEVVLNDSFTFYIHNKQIIAINAVDENSPSFKQVIDAVKVYVKPDDTETTSAEDTQTAYDFETSAPKRKPFYNQDIIQTIQTIGNQTDDTPFPKGAYSSKIDLGKYNYVYFHAKLRKPIWKNCTVHYKLHIYDDFGNLISDLSTDLDCTPGCNLLSKGLILRSSDGTYLPAGSYHAEASVDDSLTVKYAFLLIDSQPAASKPNTPAKKPDKASSPNIQSNGYWKCVCGRTHAAYVDSCPCGTSKRDVKFAFGAFDNAQTTGNMTSKKDARVPKDANISDWMCSCGYKNRGNAAYCSSCFRDNPMAKKGRGMPQKIGCVAAVIKIEAI